MFPGSNNSKFKMQNAKFSSLSDLGCLFQGNLGSFAGQYGSAVQKRAEMLQAAGRYFCYGTDGHSPRSLREHVGRGARGNLERFVRGV